MYYAKQNVFDDELIHWGVEKGAKAQGHKYFKREGTPGHYKYYYTEAQYKAEKGAQVKSQNGKNTQKTSSSSNTQSWKTSLIKRFNDTAKSANKFANKVSKEAEKSLNNAKKSANKFANKVSKEAEKSLNNAKKSAYVSMMEAKWATKKAMSNAGKVANEIGKKLGEGVYAVYEYRKQKQYEEFDRKYKKYQDKNQTAETKSIDNMQQVNPKYSPVNKNTAENCANCTQAFIMREMGYDVEARERKETNYNAKNGDPDYISKMWNKKWTTEDMTGDVSKQARSIESKIINDAKGKDSIGQIGVYWAAGGGHSLAYKVEKGKVTIYDAQTNNMYSVEDIVKRSSRFMYMDLSDAKYSASMYEYVKPKNGSKTKNKYKTEWLENFGA